MTFRLAGVDVPRVGLGTNRLTTASEHLTFVREAVAAGVAAAAERLGVTENAVKLAWLLRRSPVVLPIPGTLSIEHLRENLSALELELGDAELLRT